MAKTEGEKKEYNRGYYRATVNYRDRAARALEIARGYRAKAEEAIYHDTPPRCRNCARWTRGGEHTLWGYCRADFDWAAGEQAMWGEPSVGREPIRIITQEMFGCVNWIAPLPSRGGG